MYCEQTISTECCNLVPIQAEWMGTGDARDVDGGSKKGNF